MVVFPAPDGPTSATVSPRSTVRSADATVAAKRVSEPDPERHRVTSLTERRTSALDHDEKRADRERDVEVDVELLVDRERERLRDALQRAGEHDRRAELAEPARERQRRSGAETAAREREHHAEKDASAVVRRACARPRGAFGSTASNEAIAVRR